MEQKIGQDIMPKVYIGIRFIKNSLMLIFLLLIYSCKKVEVHDTNFKRHVAVKQHDTIMEYTNEIDLKLNSQKLYYHVSHLVNLETDKDSVIESYFILNEKKYQTPKKFENYSIFNYEYSLFPKYKSGEYNYIKTYLNNGRYYVLVQSINPFCNGSNCQSYYLHLLIIDNKIIKSNTVYFYKSNEVNFDDVVIKFNNSDVLLMDGKRLIGKIL